MNYSVISLSSAVSGRAELREIVNGLLIHMLGIGLPSALFARASAGR